MYKTNKKEDKMDLNKVLSDINYFIEKRDSYFTIKLQVAGKGMFNFVIIGVSLDNKTKSEKDEIVKYFSELSESINRVGYEHDEKFESEVVEFIEKNLSSQISQTHILLRMRFSKKIPKIKISKHGGGTIFTQTCYQSGVLDLD